MRISSPADCPIASFSEEIDGPVESVSWADCADGVVEEFATDSSATLSDLDPVYEEHSRQFYRLFRSESTTCACECLEDEGYPVVDTTARDGSLFVTFHLSDRDELERTVERVRSAGADVSIERLTGDPRDESEDLVSIDTSSLTDRQREVLSVAYEMGYFQHPREANVDEVADSLDLSPSTVIQHLTAAQRKLFDELPLEG